MTPHTDTFDVLFLIARPAAGKSEIIDYLKRTPESERRQRFHIGQFDELDDFPMIWTWFEEDAILARMGKPRLHTDDQGYFLHTYFWHVLIERLDLEYHKLIRDHPTYHENHSVIIEFARGSEHGGFSEAFHHFSEDTLSRGAILYINVSWQESLRKNRRRFNPDRPDSILEHGVPDDKLEKMYKASDWEQFSAADPEFITIKGVKVPYVIFENEDDVTTARGPELGQRLEETLNRLWQINRK
ncbi:MAG: hypothetical protein DSY55_01310 [Clostridia bacterium]|nr:MAG: hypothetical protein DSY55_01310 [Clostridia bacterium]